MELQVTNVGSDIAIVLSPEALDFLKARVGDVFHVTEAPGGAYRLTPFDPDFEKQMSSARKIMAQDRGVGRESGA